MLLAWYFGQICTSTGGGRSQSLYFICDPRYWGCLKTKAKQVPFTDQDDLDEMMRDPRYWKPGERDQNFVNKVTDGFNKLYGS